MYIVDLLDNTDSCTLSFPLSRVDYFLDPALLGTSELLGVFVRQHLLPTSQTRIRSIIRST